ncbi:hypothetical protein EC912_101183 [Luteibacter rhizovicinus]|uniref:Uncharacterized protein n=1 Tax=Luteibacter rhizovicinus TaxID=242606 RepID=A0A4R3YZ74_9GAMM|nr:hypothetical protein [Luteibacter rhizovicinus]TCV97188.1 hypothetical protein EC912_101183 [Luteibacter rhizovicinus]
MNNPIARLVPLAFCALALAACADHKAKPATKTVTTTSTTVVPAAPATSTHTTSGGTKTTSTTPRTSRQASANNAPLPENTGIAACDEYLASYKSCHLAAGIYKSGDIETRYEDMRTSLLRQSQDPDMRDQLSARCTSLASQLKQALHGKSCTDAPAPASTR